MTRVDSTGRDTPPAVSLAVKIDEISAPLRGLSQEADGRLLAVGERLGDMLAVLGRLTRCFELLPQEIENEALHEAAHRFGAIASDVTAMAQAFTEEQASLSRLAVLSQQVGTRIAQLRNTLRAISILAVNALIEAAHIDTNREDLTIFAKEIIRLAKAAESTTDGYAKGHEAVAGLLRRASEIQATFAATHGMTLRSAGQQLEAALRALEMRRAQAADAASEIERRSKLISGQVGVVVMALQIGDITRQRLEHVSETLNILSASIEGDERPEPDFWASGLTESQKAAVAMLVCRTQSAQTIQAATEFEGEIGRVIASLARLADEALGIVRHGNEVYGTAGAGDGSFLEDLQVSLRMTGALVRKCETARNAVDQAVASVAGSVGGLLERLGSVRSLEVDMRLVGLNTALKCGRLGVAGRTLNVVAHELRGHANRTVQDVDALMSALQEMAAAARQIERDREGRGTDRMAAVEQEMTVHLQPFAACGLRLSQALAILAEQGGMVSTALGETAAGITVHEIVAKDLKASSERLDGLAGSLAVDDTDLEVARERVRQFSTGRYTMASEREIHAQFATAPSGDAIASAGPSSPAATEMSLDDVLF